MLWKKATGDDATAIISIHYQQNPSSIAALKDAFLEIGDTGTIRTIIFTSEHQKNWCTGLDIGWIMKQYTADNPGAVKKLFIDGTLSVFKKMITVPIVTIAAINGHVWGNGVMFSCLCDIRYMRSDRGYFCLPEAEMGLVDAFTPSSLELLKHRYDSYITEVMIPTAKKVTASELKEYGIIEQACPDRESVMETALTRARELGQDHVLRQGILNDRKSWIAPVLRAIEEEDEARFDYIIEKFWDFINKMQKK